MAAIPIRYDFLPQGAIPLYVTDGGSVFMSEDMKSVEPMPRRAVVPTFELSGENAPVRDELRRLMAVVAEAAGGYCTLVVHVRTSYVMGDRSAAGYVRVLQCGVMAAPGMDDPLLSADPFFPSSVDDLVSADALNAAAVGAVLDS